MGAKQRTREEKSEEQRGLACTGTLTGVFRCRSALLRTRWSDPGGSCAGAGSSEQSQGSPARPAQVRPLEPGACPEVGSPCWGCHGGVRGLGGTETEGGIALGYDLQQGSVKVSGGWMTGLLTRCWPEVKLTEQAVRNCWTRNEKNIGFNK